MENRMEKYSQSKDKDVNRKSKHYDSYREVYGMDFDDFEALPISESTNEIDITSLKKVVTSREEYKRLKELGAMITKKIQVEEIQETVNKDAEEKVYDINEMIKKAREKEEAKIVEKEDSKEFLAEPNFLTMIESIAIPNKETPLEEVTEAEETDLGGMGVTLSLDILSDLKPGEDTAVSESIRDLNTQAEEIKKEETFEKAVEDFYSTGYKFAKADFDGADNFMIEKKRNPVLNALIIILVIAILATGVIYLLEYLDIKVFDMIKF